MPASTAPKALLKSSCPAKPTASVAEAAHPRFVIPTPNGGGILVVYCSVCRPSTLCTQFFGVADSSAAFGVGMTRTIEQGDPESFSPNCEAALGLLLLRLGLKPSPFKTLCDREIERFNELPDYLSALGWSK